MKWIEQQSLKAFNTFGLDANAARFVSVKSVDALASFCKQNKAPLFILGGGSNILITKDIEKMVLKNEIKGIRLLRSFKHCVHIEIGGGESWHQSVLWAIRKGYGGIENLSLIPGTVGAAPIQNIGAYGVELKDVFVKLEAIELASGRKQVFYHKDCHFAYRNSIFKTKLKGKFFITKIVLRLSKKPHRVNISYGAIQSTLDSKGIKKPSIKQISDVVIKIRQSKLPDPKKLGNAGSFFKNPEISKRQFKQLEKKFPDIVSYPQNNGKIKIPAGWLIERCGWKGKKIGNTGSHAQQALVIVNYGGASGKEIYAHAQNVIKSVKKHFGILLSPEVNII